MKQSLIFLALGLSQASAGVVEPPTSGPSYWADGNTNCDPGVDVPRDDVNITDIAFEASWLTQTEQHFDTELRYYPEQVIPYEMRSSVFFYLTGLNGGQWDNLTPAQSDKCGFEFDFSSGQSIHSSEFTFPKYCFNTQTVGESTVWSTDIEYFYCIGDKETCDRVDGAADVLNFQKDNRQSLRDKAYCTKLTYQLTVTYTPGAPLNEVLKFVLEYIRDPVEPIEQFFDFSGAPAYLSEDVLWAICDEDDLGVYDYPACVGRLAVNPEPRVLSLSTDDIANDFALFFALNGTDKEFVDDQHPLTIVVDNSEMWLFHALYSQNNYDSCLAPLCTKVTEQAVMDVGVFGVDSEVPENHMVRLKGSMPLFIDGDQPSDMQCDISFCTMVWVLNFRSLQTGRRLRLAKPMRFHVKPQMGPLELSDRSLQSDSEQKSATQGRAAKVTVGEGRLPGDGPTDEELPAPGSPPDVLFPVLGAVAGVFVLVGFVVVKRKRRNKEECETEASKPECGSAEILPNGVKFTGVEVVTA